MSDMPVCTGSIPIKEEKRSIKETIKKEFKEDKKLFVLLFVVFILMTSFLAWSVHVGGDSIFNGSFWKEKFHRAFSDNPFDNTSVLVVKDNITGEDKIVIIRK